LTGAASLGYLAMCGVGIIYLLAYTFFFPALEIHYARVSNFAECFRVGKIMRVATRNPGNYISAWLVGILLSFLIALFSAVLSVVIGWIPCLGQIIWLVVLIFSSIWGWTVISHIYGQVGL
ncbi:MAG: DUF4013 domain-containing protein, partial [Armatimonadetes bacterium]|nr:DUF4013 domain-containing protein [Armatimonadota bacterium]NIO96266.1 DUF4013 domain-containing protein [Armatimonadota bacterium]